MATTEHVRTANKNIEKTNLLRTTTRTTRTTRTTTRMRQKKRWKTQARRFTSWSWDSLWQDYHHETCSPMLPWTHTLVCVAPQPTFGGGCQTMHPLQQACPQSGILCWGIWPHLYPPLTRQVPRPRPLHSGSSSMQPVLAMGRCLMTVAARAAEKVCVLLSTTLNYSQQVFQLLLSTSLSPTLSTYSLNHHPVTHFGIQKYRSSS